MKYCHNVLCGCRISQSLALFGLPKPLVLNQWCGMRPEFQTKMMLNHLQVGVSMPAARAHHHVATMLLPPEVSDKLLVVCI
jgi:hypothetical protein